MKKNSNKIFFIIFLIIFFSIPSVIRIVGPGYYSLHDDMHVAWLYEMNRAITSGQFPPRWAPDLSFSYGYPLFDFVYPLPFYLGEIFYKAGFSLVASVKSVFILSLILSGLTMFIFLKRNFTNFSSIVGAIIYVYTPYRAVDVYVRGAIGEAISFIFIPLVAWAEDKALREGGRKNITLLAVSLSFLVLSHNIAFFMSFPFLILYGLTVILRLQQKKAAILRFLGGTLLGIAMSSFFWLPALLDQQYMVADTVFNYWDHFPFIRQLIIPTWGYGISTWGPNDGMSFQIGLANIFAFLIVAISLLWSKFRNKLDKKRRPILIWAIVSLAFTLYLMNIRSEFIWRNIPLMPYFQFPWRFLILTTFFTAFLVGFLEDLPFRPAPRRLLAMGVLLFAMISNLSYFSPEKIMPERNDVYFMNRYFANKTKEGYSKETSPVYQTLKEEYLRLPLWTEERPERLPDRKIDAKEGSLIFQEKSPVFYTAQIDTENYSEVAFNNYYFPGWNAYIDGVQTKLEIKKPYGSMAISVPKGSHQLLFTFTETPLRLFSDVVSVAAITIALLLLWPIEVKAKLKVFQHDIAN